MSRAYNMYVMIHHLKAGRASAGHRRRGRRLEIDWFDGVAGQLDGDGDGSLGGGETDREFTQRLAVVIQRRLLRDRDPQHLPRKSAS